MTASIENTIFESIPINNTFNISNFVWQKYQNFAIPKMKKSINVLKKTRQNVDLLSILDAKKELQSIEPLYTIIQKSYDNMKNNTDVNSEKFVAVVKEFENVFAERIEALEDKAEPNYMYNLFLSTCNDWNEPENDHWDTENY